jgi:hypothetical protein
MDGRIEKWKGCSLADAEKILCLTLKSVIVIHRYSKYMLNLFKFNNNIN